MSKNGQTHVMLQDFESVSDYFGTLCTEGLKVRFLEKDATNEWANEQH